MLFGLMNAPSTLPRIINYILLDILDKNLYLDNILIFSKIEEECSQV